ncbi:MAG: MarR family winged helix-turn-helix transcriptional regulator, partial [Candidatus Melainabacteria bacterium]
LEGMTQMDLSKELIIAKSNLVGLIDKLEEKEFLERKINSADRRFNKIILTEKGLDFIKEIKNDYFEEVDSLINNLLETEKKALINSMRKIQQFLKEEKQIN